jgi:hypothetical protein
MKFSRLSEPVHAARNVVCLKAIFTGEEQGWQQTKAEEPETGAEYRPPARAAGLKDGDFRRNTLRGERGGDCRICLNGFHTTEMVLLFGVVLPIFGKGGGVCAVVGSYCGQGTGSYATHGNFFDRTAECLSGCLPNGAAVPVAAPLQPCRVATPGATEAGLPSPAFTTLARERLGSRSYFGHRLAAVVCDARCQQAELR